MNILNFGTYAKIIKEGMSKATNESVCQDLLGLIINNENLFQTKHGIYHMDSSQCSKWINCKENIPKKIKIMANYFEIQNNSDEYFNEKILFKLNELKQEDTYFTLYKLINSDNTISKEKKNILISFYENNNYCEFLSKTFLYALQKDNIINKEENKTINNFPVIMNVFKNKLYLLKKAYEQYISKEIKIIPKQIQNHEKAYINQILKAYADAENLDELCLEDLVNYEEYHKRFERERIYYYSAIQVETLINNCLSDNEVNEFNILKEETLDAILRIVEKDYPNGLVRLDAVMERVLSISLNKSFIVEFTSLIGHRERMGICHMLVRDGKFSWV